MGLDQMQQHLPGQTEAYLLLLFGSADAFDPSTFDAETSASNVISIAEYASGTLGMITVIGTAPPNIHTPEEGTCVIELNAMIVDMAAAEGFLVADHHSAMVDAAGGDLTNVLSQDGRHPDDFGYAVMAETWYKAITGSDDFPIPTQRFDSEELQFTALGTR
jgi:lysophospholipase L1-like esterase